MGEVVILTCQFGRFVGEVEDLSELEKIPVKLKKPCSIVAAEIQVPHPQYKGVMQKQMKFALVYEGFPEIFINSNQFVWTVAPSDVEKIYRQEIARAAGLQIISMEELQQLQQQAARAMAPQGGPGFGGMPPGFGGMPGAPGVKPKF